MSNFRLRLAYADSFGGGQFLVWVFLLLVLLLVGLVGDWLRSPTRSSQRFFALICREGLLPR